MLNIATAYKILIFSLAYINVGKLDSVGAWRNPNACGSNALYTILQCHGHHISFDKLYAELYSINNLNTELSLHDLLSVARQYNNKYIVSKPSENQLCTIPKPAILHIDDDGSSIRHYIVILHASNDYIVIADPGQLWITSITWRDLYKRWSGYALHLSARSIIADVVTPISIGAILTFSIYCICRLIRRGIKCTYS